MSMNTTPNLRTDNLWLLMRRFSVPGILGTLIISINTFVDSIYISHFIGPDALAGISLVFPFTIITTSVMVLIAYGSSSVLSRAIGADDVHIQKQVYSNLFTLSVIASIILTGAGYFFGEDFIFLMGGEGAVLQYGTDYYEVWVQGTFFSVFGIASNGLIRAEGRIKQAMFYSGISVLGNIVLTPLLMYYGNLGIKGAALAYVLAMGFYTFLTTKYFLSGKSSFKIGKISFGIKKEILIPVLSVGFSAFMLQSTGFIRQAFMFRTMAHYGSDDDLAFFAAVFRIFSFSMIPVLGLLQSLQPIVGVNYGAGDLERSRSAVNVYRTGSSILILLIWIPVMLFPELMLSTLLPGKVFSSADLMNFRIVFLIMPLLPIASSGIIYFQAVGKGGTSSFLSIGRELGLFIPLIVVIPFFLGHRGVYYSIAIENLLYVSIVLLITQLEFKKSYNLQATANGLNTTS